MNPANGHMNMFTETGPITIGEIYPNEASFLQSKNGEGYSPFARVKLLIDTGSNISGIDRRVVRKLNLSRYEENAEVNGVGGMHSVFRYRCVLFLKIFGMKGLPLDILEGDYGASPYDGVIGRDVLQYCTFEYHGPSNTYRLQALEF